MSETVVRLSGHYTTTEKRFLIFSNEVPHPLTDLTPEQILTRFDEADASGDETCKAELEKMVLDHLTEKHPIEATPKETEDEKPEGFFGRIARWLSGPLFAYGVFSGVINGVITTFLSILSLLTKLHMATVFAVDALIGGIFALANVANFFNNEVEFLKKNLKIGSEHLIEPTLTAHLNQIEQSHLINTHLAEMAYQDKSAPSFQIFLKLAERFSENALKKAGNGGLFNQPFKPSSFQKWRFRISVSIGSIIVGAGTLYGAGMASTISLIPLLSTMIAPPLAVLIGVSYVFIAVTAALIFYFNKQFSAPNKQMDLFKHVKKELKTYKKHHRSPTKLFSEQEQIHNDQNELLYYKRTMGPVACQQNRLRKNVNAEISRGRSGFSTTMATIQKLEERRKQVLQVQEEKVQADIPTMPAEPINNVRINGTPLHPKSPPYPETPQSIARNSPAASTENFANLYARAGAFPPPSPTRAGSPVHGHAEIAQLELDENKTESNNAGQAFVFAS